MCSLFDSEHPGFIKLSVSEKNRSNRLDVTVGAHHYEQMQKQTFTMLIYFRMVVVKS